MSSDGVDSTLLGTPSSPGQPDARPATIGRFRVTGTLGSGGMGVVYAGEDPTLGRAVAIKLLRGERTDAAAARLLREAQALAKLSHPNVVTIYEAGRDGDRVYLAMELVHGATARAWRAAAPRTVEEILGVYRQAAAGLTAAHRAGLVHRDVKPENLLVGDDGRVRVTDFGLVAAHGLGPVTGHDATTPVDPIAVTMTMSGVAMGTPAYMPPEAHAARAVDARGDQWSLCVAIWEALGGARPYPGATYPELIANVCAGARVDPPTPLPDRVRAALERGLAFDPAARWPSVDALMAAMVAPAPRRGLAIGVGAVVLAGLGGGAWLLTRPQAAAAPPDAAPVIPVVVAPLDAAPAIAVVAPDAAPPTVRLRSAAAGEPTIACTGLLCGEPTLHADGITLDLTIEAPAGEVVRLPGAEGGDGATVRLDLETLVMPLALPEARAGSLHRAALPMWVEIASGPGVVGTSHSVSLQVDGVVDLLLLAALGGPSPWPGETQPRFRRDVLARVQQTDDGELVYLGTIGPPGATVWELDRIALESERVSTSPCRDAAGQYYGSVTDLQVIVLDRRTGRIDESRGFQARTPRCQDWHDVTYDRAEADAWLATLVEPRPAGQAEVPPPVVPLGGAVAGAVAAKVEADAATEAAEDKISKAIAAEGMWPQFSKAVSPLGKRVKKLGVSLDMAREIPFGLDLVTGTRNGVAIQVMQMVVPRPPGKHDTVAGLIAPTWACVVVGHRLLDPRGAQALLDAITPKIPAADAMDEAAVALGWQDVSADQILGHVVPVYVSMPWLSNRRTRPIGMAAVLAIDYTDIVAGYEPDVVADVTSARVLLVRVEGDRALAQELLDALK